MHAVSGSEHTASHAVGDSDVQSSCWDTPTDTFGVWLCDVCLGLFLLGLFFGACRHGLTVSLP